MNILKKINPKELKEEEVQTFFKQFLGKDNIKDALEKFLDEESIEKFRKILDYSFILDENEREDKYFFDLIIFSIAYEIVSIDEILSLKETLGRPNLRELLEKAVILELGLYESKDKSSYPISFLKMKENFLRNNFFKVYYDRSDIVSYKDEANIKEEIDSILNYVLEEHSYSRNDFINELNLVLQETIFSDENIYKLFISINESNPLAFKKIGVISFLLNFNEENSLDIFNDIFSSLDEYYYEFINRGKSGNFKNLGSYFYYYNVSYIANLGSFQSSKKMCRTLHNIFLDFLKLLKTRTINYN